MLGLEQSLGSRIVTYADDLVILCRTGKVEEALSRLREIMGKLKLTVNEEKTRICVVPEGVRLSGLHVRTNVFCENRPGAPGVPAIEEKHQAHGGKHSRADGPNRDRARYHKAGDQVESRAARMGELLPGRHCQQGISGGRQLHSCAVTPVVEVQAQSQATQGRDLSTLAPLRALRARTPDPAWARRGVSWVKA